MRRPGIILCFLILAVFCSAQRKGDKNLITDDEIQSEAIQQYAHFLLANTLLDSATNKDAEMVHKVAAKVFNAVKTYYEQKRKAAELKNFIWEIQLISKKEINAFCLPGARIIVGTGMLDWAQNEGSLAVVLAHELAHTLYHHGEVRLRASLRDKMGGRKFSELMSSSRAPDARDVFMASFGASNIVGLLPPYSSEDEKEADRLGMILTGLAGFNPRESIVFWERMDRLSRGPRQPVLLSTHPYTPERSSSMQEVVDEMVKAWFKPQGKG